MKKIVAEKKLLRKIEEEEEDDFDEIEEDFDESPKEKRKRRRKELKERKRFAFRYRIYAILSFLFATFFLLAWFGNAGIAGTNTYNMMSSLFGLGYALLPLTCILLGVSFVYSRTRNIGTLHMVSSLVLMVSSLALIESGLGYHKGGWIGYATYWPFQHFFGDLMAVIIVISLIVMSSMVLFDALPFSFDFITNIFKREKKEKFEEEDVTVTNYATQQEEISEPEEKLKEQRELRESKENKNKKEDDFNLSIPNIKDQKYVPPPIDLLEKDKGKSNGGDTKTNANIIKRTLLNFGIIVEMDEVTVGPTVTRYALKPAEGVRLQKIVALQQDLSLALAAHPLRIEAPIPGKSLVGIEVPNKIKSTVGLANLIGDPVFLENKHPLYLALGRGISGKPVYSNLAKAPHLLIAGTTGSGKSVTIHTIIASLIYRNGPEDLRFIFVDPKRVELTLYNNIPHLLTPVITDAKKTILSLKWAAKEMERRYDILQEHMIQNIEQYHYKVFPKLKAEKDDNGIMREPDRMPYIVIIIDELAEIMQLYPKELESSIVRLAQLSRAVGIHLILSTQRPEVNVITGLIKANIPSRIALRVPTQIDSRTILDAGGAEKLLGSGDMLYSSGEGQPERLQSAYMTEEEVKNIVKYLKDAYKNEIPNTPIELGAFSNEKMVSGSNDFGEGDSDDRYEEAREIVIQTGKASTSFLQRKMGVGYSRAAKLLDMLEERGVVGPGNGARPRDILEKSVEEESKEYDL